LAVVLLGVATPVAAAELRLTATSSPATLSYGHTKRVVFTVSMAALGRDETFRFGFRTGRFGRVAGRPVEGSPLRFVDPTLQLGAPAALLGPASLAMGPPACASDVAAHGTDVGSRSWDVRVPASTTAVATLPFEVAGPAPWPTTSYGIDVYADGRVTSPASATIARPITVHVPGPRITGRRGVQILLSSRPKATLPGVRDTEVRRGQRIMISGSTLPPRRQQRLGVTIKSPAGQRRTRWVRTDSAGRFVVRDLRLDRRGRFEIGARYVSRARSIASDHACPLGFSVR
jgi:hypothetical protein